MIGIAQKNGLEEHGQQLQLCNSRIQKARNYKVEHHENLEEDIDETVYMSKTSDTKVRK